MRHFSALAIAVLVAEPLVSAAAVAQSAPKANVRNGTLVGRYLPEYNQDVFLGVPYAQPPVGDLRFRIAQSINTSYSSPLSVTEYSAECVGYGSDQWGYAISEDCLYLNVIRPAGTKPNAKLPVGFWIHGGGYTEGGGPDQRYNSSFIVQNSVNIGTPMIVVSINYRLSVWGQIASTQVSGTGNANIALRDQRLAMHWVQENIAAFGGDPSKVTIWGESAGASSVGFHLTAYNGRDDGLFRAAIMESGNPIQYHGMYDGSHYDPSYQTLLVNAGCQNASDSLACLRSLSFTDLNNAINYTSPSSVYAFSFPVLDGDFNAEYGSVQLAAGNFVHVPIIAGANGDEGTSFGPRGLNTSAEILAELVAGTFSAPSTPLAQPLAQTILDAYPDDPCVGIPQTLGCIRPTGTLGYEYRRTSAMAGDMVFIAPRRQTCATWASNDVDAYCYRFEGWVDGLNEYSGVGHFQEIGLVFDNLMGVGYDAAPNPYMDRPQSLKNLGKLMSNSWASFIATGNPNTWRATDTKIPLWPVYNAARPHDFVFSNNVTSHTEADTFREAGMAAINALNLAMSR